MKIYIKLLVLVLAMLVTVCITGCINSGNGDESTSRSDSETTTTEPETTVDATTTEPETTTSKTTTPPTPNDDTNGPDDVPDDFIVCPGWFESYDDLMRYLEVGVGSEEDYDSAQDYIYALGDFEQMLEYLPYEELQKIFIPLTDLLGIDGSHALFDRISYIYFEMVNAGTPDPMDPFKVVYRFEIDGVELCLTVQYGGEFKVEDAKSSLSYYTDSEMCREARYTFGFSYVALKFTSKPSADIYEAFMSDADLAPLANLITDEEVSLAQMIEAINTVNAK